MNGSLGKLSRCAVYTRKSTEHNLDLAFTSRYASARPVRPTSRAKRAKAGGSSATTMTMEPSQGPRWNGRPCSGYWPMFGAAGPIPIWTCSANSLVRQDFGPGSLLSAQSSSRTY
jgi:hypothetical protein